MVLGQFDFFYTGTSNFYHRDRRPQRVAGSSQTALVYKKKSNEIKKSNGCDFVINLGVRICEGRGPISTGSERFVRRGLQR